MRSREIISELYPGKPILACVDPKSRIDVLEPGCFIDYRYSYFCVNPPKETSLEQGLRRSSNMDCLNHFVFESDIIPLQNQYKLLSELKKERLIVLAVFSGNKSIHFHVITQQSFESPADYKLAYKLIANKLFTDEFSDKYDPRCCDPTRLTRMPFGWNPIHKKVQDVLYFDPTAIQQDDFLTDIEFIKEAEKITQNSDRWKNLYGSNKGSSTIPTYGIGSLDVLSCVQNDSKEAVHRLLTKNYVKGQGHDTLLKGLAALYFFKKNGKYVYSPTSIMKIANAFPRPDKADTKSILHYILSQPRGCENCNIFKD